MNSVVTMLTMLRLLLLLCLLSSVLSYQSYRSSYRSIRTSLSSYSNGNDNVIDSLIILKEAALKRNGDVQVVKNAIDTISSSSSSKLLRSDVSLINGEYELIFSSLLPFGYFPIKEVVNFLPSFKLTSSFMLLSTISIPFGSFEGVSTVVKSKAPAEISFYNKVFKLGQLSIPINEVKEKTYRFIHIDDDYIVALSLSSSLSSSSGTLLKKL